MSFTYLLIKCNHTDLDRLDRNKHTYEIKGENVMQSKGRSFRYNMTLQYII